MVFMFIIIAVFVGSLVAVLICGFQQNEDYIYVTKQWIAFGETLAVFVFFVITTTLFFREAYKRQHAQLIDHYKAYLFVIAGILAVLINSIVCLGILDEHMYRAMKNIDPTINYDETKFCYYHLNTSDIYLCNPYLSPYFLIKLLTQLLCMFLFVLFKKPKDCFLCYSKATNIQYSIFQYVRYIYTEQMLTVQRNAYILDKLKKLKGAEHMLIDLDIDDYLDPKRTLKLYMGGYDMNYMVERVGGSQYAADTE